MRRSHRNPCYDLRFPRLTILVLTLAVGTSLAFAAAASADTDLWLHVRVDGRQGESVNVNLPLSLVEAALPMIPDEHFRDGHLVLDHHHMGMDHHLTVAELRELWRELKASPDMTFITVEDHHEIVEVAKSGSYLLIDIDEHGESSQVRMPLAVVDALLSGEGESLDIRAAVEALAAHGEGELVTVTEDDEMVRVWIDRIPEAG